MKSLRTRASHPRNDDLENRWAVASAVVLTLLTLALIPGRALAQAGPEDIGQWGPVGSWPVVAIHASLLPNGKVLFWQKANGGIFQPGFQETTAYVWDPATDLVETLTDIAHNDLFCSGHSSLADGRTIVIGGHNVFLDGHDGVHLYDPDTQLWTAGGSMSQRRWYPNTVALPDGRVMTVGGHIDPGRGASGGNPAQSLKPALIPEIYDPVQDAWTRLEKAPQSLPSYPFLFVLPDGRVLQAKTTTTRTLDLSTGLWTTVDTTVNPNALGSAAMYRPGKILKSGGGHDATNAADVIDMSDAVPAWRAVAPMLHPRHDHNLVLLPDGSVLAVGGSVEENNQQDAVLPAERWDPDTELWTQMDEMDPDPRMYHSTALLLPDGRVVAAGGDNFASRQVYSPTYLFQGARPTLSSSPASVGYGAAFQVDTPDAASITSVVFMRPGSTTHAFDQNQRYVPLTFAPSAGGISVNSPSDANQAPPGSYMLFLVNDQGVPSVASFVSLSGACSDGIDDDRDGLVDYPADPGCSDADDPSELDPAVACDDGIDNDGDGVADFGPSPGIHDPGCASPTGTSELPVDHACADGVDNDGDGLIDFAQDPGCSAVDDFSERALPPCSDGMDNDGDGLSDYPDDPECSSPTWGSEAVRSECSDGIDNDGDGFTDWGFAVFNPLVDPQCTSASDGSELAVSACADGIDNDGDGLIDWDPLDPLADPQCDSASDEFEGLVCDDGLDSDGDGLIDHPQDPGCADVAGPASIENPLCQDHIDNDFDGLIDYPLDPGCSSVTSNLEQPECSDGIDNDGDGNVDLLDAECSSPSDDREAPDPERVLLIGDSITQGAVSGPPGFPYADVVSTELGGAFEVLNLGCGGASSIDWRPDTGVTICAAGFIDLWTERVLPNLPADFATVLLGTNDSTGFFEPGPVAADDYANAMEAIVDGLHAGGVAEVMLMTPPARCPTAPQATLDLLTAYRLRVFSLCQTKPGVVCGPDVFQLLDPIADYEACDVHPNAQGHTTLGNALADDVEDLSTCTANSAPGFDACAPVVDVLADGVPVGDSIVVAPGLPVQFDINASDPNGIGFPVFAWLGNGGNVQVIWNFDGAAAVGLPLAVFNPTPTVTFELGAGGISQTLTLSATVYDGSGRQTVATFDVIVTDPPSVSVLADGVAITGPLSVPSGSQVTFTAIANDDDGLGFPIFAWLGNNNPISFLWNFDGGTVPGPLYFFFHQPPVTFTLDPGETSRTFDVSVTVYDTLGSSTQIPITVNVQ